MFERFRTHNNIKHFFLYAASFLIYGACINSLGSFIPFLSSITNISETEYSYLFTCRSFGMLAGALLLKYFQKMEISNHSLMAFGMIGICIFSLLFTLTRNTTWLGIWFFLTGASYSILQILLNICILLINNPKEIEFWMMITHGMFGLGGLIGPFLALIFQTKVMMALGILLGALSIFALKIETPELLQVKTDSQSEDIVHTSKLVFPSLEVCLCFLLFIYMGSECTYGGWISSFVVMNHIADEKRATIYPTIFWTVMTVARLLLAFVSVPSSKKLKILIIGCFLSGFISLLFIYLKYLSYACYVSAVLFGISLSSIYPLIFSVPLQQGFILKENQTTNIVMAGLISEGLLTALTGALMHWASLNIFFYSLCLMALVMGILYLIYMYLIERKQNAEESHGKSKYFQLQEKIINRQK